MNLSNVRVLRSYRYAFGDEQRTNRKEATRTLYAELELVEHTWNDNYGRRNH